MRATHSAGGVVVNKEGDVLVINQRGRSWSLPKGHVEKNEIPIDAARREIYEESGVKNLEFVKELGTYRRYKMNSEAKDDLSELKIITIYLFKTLDMKLNPQDKDNPEARWIKLDEVEHILTHPKDKAFFRKIKDEIKPTKSI